MVLLKAFLFSLCANLCANAAIINSQNIGGSNAGTNQFRYMAGIATQTPYFKYWFICGGAIISERRILTSGGCVKDYVEHTERLSAVLGSPSYGTTDVATVVYIEDVILHPAFDKKYFLNDLAILRTKEKMISLYSVPLPRIDLTSGIELKAVATGWRLEKVSY